MDNPDLQEKNIHKNKNSNIVLRLDNYCATFAKFVRFRSYSSATEIQVAILLSSPANFFPSFQALQYFLVALKEIILNLVHGKIL